LVNDRSAVGIWIRIKKEVEKLRGNMAEHYPPSTRFLLFLFSLLIFYRFLFHCKPFIISYFSRNQVSHIVHNKVSFNLGVADLNC